MPTRWTLVSALLLASLFGCAHDTGTMMPSADAGIDQVPPSDPTAIGDWLDAGYYQGWHCEMGSHPARPPSPHGPAHVCQNSIVDGAVSGSGQFPVGATLVKEQLDGAGNLFAISVEARTSSAAGSAGWFYYRRQGTMVTHQGQAQSFCAGCHGTAPRDGVWFLVP